MRLCLKIVCVVIMIMSYVLGWSQTTQQPKEIDYEKIELYREIGLSAYFEMDYEEAQRKLGYVIRYIKDDHEAYFYRALSKAKQDNLKGAIRDFTKAIEIDGNNIDYFFKRATAEYHLADWDDALNDFSKVIELDPTNSLAHYHRAYCYQNLGNYIGACRDLKVAAHKNFAPAVKTFKKSCNTDGTPRFKGKSN
ncbi:MAG: tetratricopeptide repeat protein [Flavobacteriales bacterium]|nr:tetratricopeptide repeat protein [Flavobacteriales bacterium]